MIRKKSWRGVIRGVVSFILVFALSLGQVWAQDSDVVDPGDSGDTDLADPDTGIPIDGGISILFAAGALAGARKIYKDKQKQKQADF